MKDGSVVLALGAYYAEDALPESSTQKRPDSRAQTMQYAPPNPMHPIETPSNMLKKRV
jgi:hypothetical protein